jgi:hypothetical protein
MRMRGRSPLSAALVLVKIAGSALAIFAAQMQAAPAERTNAVPQRLSIRWISGQSGKMAVEVSGLGAAILQQLRQSKWDPPQWQRLLAVYAEPGGGTVDLGLPPMLGGYILESGLLRFEPRFPLESGIRYRAVLRPAQLPEGSEPASEPITAIFQLPQRQSNPTTIVSHVYPSAALLPENLLKFYVHFSAPMSRGHIYDHIHLRDETGKEIELPFLEIDEELWDPTMTRLTLLIDPGRIKRGVRPLEEIGPALQDGKRYSLVIDRIWQDATGNLLKEGYEKVFKVGPPDRQPPDPAHWRIQPPKSATRDELTIMFLKPMDHALAQRVITVSGHAGAPIEGDTALEDEERRWKFVPANPWRPGRYQLLVQTTIEDLAGNNIGKAFEVDLFEGVQRRLTRSNVKLSFEVR